MREGDLLSLNLIYGMKSYITPKRIDFVVTQVTLNRGWWNGRRHTAWRRCYRGRLNAEAGSRLRRTQTR